MTVDDNNENSTPNTGPTNHKISPGALLISAALENGFVKLERELDQKEQLIRRVIYVLLIVSSVALPFIAFFSWELASTMNTNMAAMKESMGDMKDDMATWTIWMTAWLP